VEKGLSLRAKLPATDDEPAKVRWKMCNPDVFSIRNSSRQDYLEPIVHEIKVTRADLLGDLPDGHSKCSTYGQSNCSTPAHRKLMC
jgi:hypothetical protein